MAERPAGRTEPQRCSARAGWRVYADGWPHLTSAGLDSFFTPWHGVLYGGFMLLAASLDLIVWRRRHIGRRRTDRLPCATAGGWPAT